MNTSMPTTSNDLAALVSGGSSSGSTSLLKGIVAGLTNARSVSPETGSGNASDFQTMLDDTPATVVGGSDGTGKTKPTAFGQLLGEGLTTVSDQGRCVLSTELSAVATATLQIRGIVTGLNQSQPEENQTGEVTQSSRGLLAPVPTDETVATEVTADGTTSTTEISAQVTTARGKLRTAHSRARLSARLLTTGSVVDLMAKVKTTSTKESKPAAPESTPAKEMISAPILNSLTVADVAAMNLANPGVAPATVLIGVTTPGITLSNAVFGPETAGDTAAEEGTVTPSGLNTDESVLPAAEDSVPATDGNATRPVNTGQGSAATAQAPAKGLRTHAMLNRPAGQYFTRTDSRLPSVENHQCATETTPSVPAGQTVAAPVSADQRRELIETVAGLLAPLWATVPNGLPQNLSVAPEGSANADVAMSGGEEKSLSTMVTFKLAGRPPFTIALPYASANSATEDAAPVQSDDASAGQTVSSAFQFDAAILAKLDSVVPNLSSLDFRIQLKAKIEAAWAKADLLAGASAAGTVPVTNNADVPSGDGLLGLEAVNNPGELVSNKGSSGQNLYSPAELSQATPEILGETAVVTPAELLKQSQRPALKDEPAVAPVELLIEMPNLGSLASEIIAPQTVPVVQERKPVGRFGRAEKTAGDFRSARSDPKENNSSSEKTFLSAAGQELKSKLSEAGTDVAISSNNMSAQFTSRRLTVDPLELPPRFNARGEYLPSFNETQNFSAAAETAENTTPAPVLAHRAVETIMNVVEAQRNGAANASSVNLHFKFGGDDLAVRVQLRGGEVLTQFLTDSAELRSALSSEWQNMAGQGGSSGLRLLEPSILPASANVSTGFGSTSQGQGHSHQQQQAQQHAQTAAAFSELRGLRRGASVLTPVKETAPRVSIAQPTSQHLTAVA